MVFHSAKRRLVAYDKGKESGSPLAKDTLRLEDQIRSPKFIQKLFGSKHPCLLNLRTEIPQKVINNALTLTGLNNEIISVKDVREELAKRLPKQPGLVNKIMGLIDLERRYPGLNHRQLHEVSGPDTLSAWSIGKLRRALKKTGVSYMVDETISLPALNLHVLDETYTLEDSIVGFGEMNGRKDVENATNVPPYSPTLTDGHISRPAPQIIGFQQDHVDNLSSELFGVPTIIVSPPPQAFPATPADSVIETAWHEELLIEPDISAAADVEMLSEHDTTLPPWFDNLTDAQQVAYLNDHIVEGFLSGYRQLARPPVKPKKGTRSSHGRAGG